MSERLSAKVQNQQVVLASSSIYRRQILQRLGIAFDWAPPDIDESPLVGESARQLVERLAIAKAQSVARDYPGDLIIGSDQVAEQDGKIIGKPADHADAVKQLQAASGSLATLFCGIALVNGMNGQIRSDVVTVKVECRELTDAEIERYLLADKPYNCCGSLKVESLGITLLRRIRSDDPNAITGLPVIRLLELLREAGLSLP